MRRWLAAAALLATACTSDIAPLPSPSDPGSGGEDPTAIPDDGKSGDTTEPDTDSDTDAPDTESLDADSPDTEAAD